MSVVRRAFSSFDISYLLHNDPEFRRVNISLFINSLFSASSELRFDGARAARRSNKRLKSVILNFVLSHLYLLRQLNFGVCFIHSLPSRQRLFDQAYRREL